MKSYSESYKNAGVDITAGYRAVELMREHVKSTNIPGALSPIGGFGGLFEPDLKGMEQPVLVSGTDGVGTKLRLAMLLGRHDTVGIDCVAMCVNDIICCGARPLFFLDYVAVGKNVPERVASIVAGVARGCVESSCALIGGETAEMPGFYAPDEYDLAGFAVGIVDKGRILDPARVQEGDAIVALASSGVHSNGFSLVRKVFGIDSDRVPLDVWVDELRTTLGLALLEPTRIYVRPVLKLLDSVNVHSLAHITGGGFYENIPRSLPSGLQARIERQSLEIPALFGYIQRAGQIPERDMFNTFNMGVGMSAIVPKDEADQAVSILRSCGVKASVIGEVVRGEDGVELC